jgi:CTP synthase
MKKCKYIFITGGVVSSLGKGISCASLGYLLKARGLNVSILKLDPYLNVDPGTMSPFQHGEVYVTDDGAETDLDLGHYERFLDQNMSKLNNATTGQIYDETLREERKGVFLGATIQVIPHITDKIKKRIRSVNQNKDLDVIIVEIGGTVGDIESLPFLEAIRQFGLDEGRDHTIFVHLTLVPFISGGDELKTKPTQHSVMRLREIGIQPDILLCRSDRSLPKPVRDKIALFCNVPAEAVIEAVDVPTIYEVPLVFARQKFDTLVASHFGFNGKKADLGAWERLIERFKSIRQEISIAICGKYVTLPDAYKSIMESFVHAGIENDVKVNLIWVNTEEIRKGNERKHLKDVAGILVPGGFGERGIEGKLLTVKYAREKGVPFFGICLGLQCAVIEFSRNVLGWSDSHSSEFEPHTSHPVIDIMEDQKKVTEKGGTMRLGAYDCLVKKGTKAFRAYHSEHISERHRHRYEVNNQYRDALVKKGMVVSGLSPDRNLVEMVELRNHPWFVGCQFHPELKSRAMHAHPLFREFVKAALKFDKERKRRGLSKQHGR